MKRFKLPFPADIFFISAQLTVLIYIKKLKKRIVEKRMKLINKFALLNGWDNQAPTKDCLEKQFTKANLKFLPNLKDFITIKK